MLIAILLTPIYLVIIITYIQRQLEIAYFAPGVLGAATDWCRHVANLTKY